MNKLLTIIRREYAERVRNKMFIIATVLGPALMIVLFVLPGLLAGVSVGGATRLAVIDETGRLAHRVRDALQAGDGNQGAAADDAERRNENGRDRAAAPGARYVVEVVAADPARPLDEVKRELGERVRGGQLDAYLVIPPNVFAGGNPEYYGRNVSDIILRQQLRDKLSRVVTEQRLVDQQIDERKVRELSQPVSLTSFKVSAEGQERDSGAGFILAYIAGGFIYLTMLVYGSMMLSAVVEEKTTRVSEMLFSSAPPLPLMLGKLIGISLVALTQYVVWLAAFALLGLFGASALAASGSSFSLPSVPASVFVYFLLFFLLGYFVYATLYLLIGTMVTNAQEGQQVAMPVITLLIIAFSLSFPVIRSPGSALAFWLSLIPFFAPITMLLRIMTETPPLWQILLSLAIGFATVAGLVWLAARSYRVGMLMYGKRASIPEVWRWIRYS